MSVIGWKRPRKFLASHINDFCSFNGCQFDQRVLRLRQFATDSRYGCQPRPTKYLDDHLFPSPSANRFT